MDNLGRVFYAELRYDMLAENYDELEAVFDELSRRFVNFGLRSWADLTVGRARANRRLVNFLSTARLLLDHTDHDLCRVYGATSAQRDAYNEARRRQYDAKLGYRVLEELRNYSQHRAIPIHGISYGGELMSEDPDKRVLHTLKPTLATTQLRAEGKIKKAVIRELEAIGPEVPLRPLLREYFTSLGAIHNQLRTIYLTDEDTWHATLRSVKAEFCSKVDCKDAMVSEAAALDGSGARREGVALYDGIVSQARAWRQKNRANVDLTRRLRSSE